HRLHRPGAQIEDPRTAPGHLKDHTQAVRRHGRSANRRAFLWRSIDLRLAVRNVGDSQLIVVREGDTPTVWKPGTGPRLTSAKRRQADHPGRLHVAHPEVPDPRAPRFAAHEREPLAVGRPARQLGVAGAAAAPDVRAVDLREIDGTAAVAVGVESDLAALRRAAG